MSNECRWLPIPGWEGFYEVSDSGRVRSLPRPAIKRRRVYGGQEVKPAISPNDYLYVMLHRPQQTKQNRRYVHRLVLQAFVGPCPDGMQAAHGNGIRSDNRLANLRWTSIKDNHADKRTHGTMVRGEMAPRSRFTEQCVRRMHDMRACGANQKDIGTWFGTTQSIVSAILRGRNWGHVR